MRLRASGNCDQNLYAGTGRMMLGRWRQPLARFLRQAPPVLRSTDAYGLWASSYPPRAHNAFMALEESTLLDVVPPLGGCAVLDLACGSGRYAQTAMARGAARVVGVDNSAPMLKRGDGFSRVRALMTALPLSDGAFDVIICGLATGHVPAPALAPAFAEMARVARPGGTVAFSDFHPHLYARGERRSFRLPDGRRYEIEHYPHPVTDYVRALAAAQLRVVAIREPTVSLAGEAVPAVLAIAARRA